ncbi:hypothetical protein BCV70DRAFT_20461 [Testicularia cyperi]|uniref:BPL/LPL catalytic domain-containing protein n=1 Tax=Testicularia cyperi TaxID=1882483 RepID=A0A317Y0N0_9BASI|nr:hypothetical protein BCV70DRAFT_20461 [Testicularia cyperi]
MSDVLVYSGPGVSNSALHHTLKTLRCLLSTYDVKTVDARTLALDPWQKGTSLIVIPGGRDLPYVSELSRPYHRDLDGTSSSTTHRADQRIRDFVEQGGAFLGICAGAYYASAHCSFELGTAMQVDGARPALQFFPGTCRGTVYPGFVYESDKGARIIDIERRLATSPSRWRCHYNGGGAFMSADKYASAGVEVLAAYIEIQPDELTLDIDLSDEASKRPQTTSPPPRPNYAGEAAAVLCSPGRGKALLFGTHPEFPLLPSSTPVANAENDPRLQADRDEQERQLVEHEKQRLRWLVQLFADRLGLRAELPAWAAHVTAGATTGSTATEEAEPKLLPIFAAAVDTEESALDEMVQQMAKEKSSSPAGHLAPTATASKPLAELTKASVRDSNDTLHFLPATTESVQAAIEVCRSADYTAYSKPIVPPLTPTPSDGPAPTDRVGEVEVDLDSVPKYVLVSSRDSFSGKLQLPNPDSLPHWSIEEYARYLAHFRELNASRESAGEPGHWTSWKAPFDPFNPFGSSVAAGFASQPARFGSPMLYSQMVTSTQTLLDKNFRWLSSLPVGTTFFATQQMSGRGRGGNRWISPKGCLQFSTVFRVPVTMAAKTVFLQYLSGLAVVEGVRLALGDSSSARAVGQQVRLKWPNDVYAEVPAVEDGRAKTATFDLNGKRYAKLGGILVNSQFSGGNEFVLVSGCGVNCLNPRPTTSVSDLVQMHNQRVQSDEIEGETLEQVSQEKLAGAILSTFDSIWKVFLQRGGDFRPFVAKYRDIWLHSDQETTLTSDALRSEGTGDEERVRIVGISSDHGLLQAVPLTSNVTSSDANAWGDANNSQSYRIIQLQPDGNSFDMLQNLVKRKT